MDMTDITWLSKQLAHSLMALKAFAPATYALVLLANGDPSLAGILAMNAHFAAWVYHRLVVTEIVDVLRADSDSLESENREEEK